MRQNELHSDPNWILHNLSVLIDKEPLKIQIKKRSKRFNINVSSNEIVIIQQTLPISLLGLNNKK